MTLTYDGKTYTDIVPVPRIVACCPECGGSLLVQVSEWESDTGTPTEFGVEVDCDRDDTCEDDPKFPHRWGHGEWQSTVASVRAWGAKWIRCDGGKQ